MLDYQKGTVVCPFCENKIDVEKYTLHETNISRLGKRKNIFKSALVGEMLVPRRANINMHRQKRVSWICKANGNCGDAIGLSEHETVFLQDWNETNAKHRS